MKPRPHRVPTHADGDSASGSELPARRSRLAAWAGISGLPDGGLNMAFEAAERHALGACSEHTAIRWRGRLGEHRELSYRELHEASVRFAAVLRGLGIAEGDRISVLLGRVPELHVALLGTLRIGAVFSPLFSAFGPEPIRARIELAGSRVLVTTRTLFDRKVASLLPTLPSLDRILLLAPEPSASDGMILDLGSSLADADPAVGYRSPTTPETPALLHFTSGTTGRPKGAVHVHEAIVCHAATARSVFELGPDDVFWCTADPGWVTGISYGSLAPLARGATLLVDEGELEGTRWYDLLEEERVTVWYTAPTAIRMLRRLGPEALAGRTFPRLRLLASVGEPLDATSVLWGREAFGQPFLDTWWQTETGAIAVANQPALAVRPGSMGQAVEGMEARVVRRRPDGGLDPVDAPDEVGELALRAGWPSMFRAYLDQEETYRACFRSGWYLSGDLVRRDEDGYFWFVGRADDAIQSAGHLIGPSEVEGALLEHPAVAEVGVIGKPDATALEIVKAFVVPTPGYEPGERLVRELRAHARRRLGPAIAPREIEFRDRLPKTRSGKILRRVLRDEEAGPPMTDPPTGEA